MASESYRKNLIDYIKKNISKGYTVESLKWALVRQGYSRTDIQRAIEEAHKELAVSAPILKEKPIIKHEIIDEHNKSITIKKPFWRRILGL